MLSTLENLFKLARERKEKPVDGSYTNKLLSDKSLSEALGKNAKQVVLANQGAVNTTCKAINERLPWGK